jgi:hypothetical protein
MCTLIYIYIYIYIYKETERKHSTPFFQYMQAQARMHINTFTQGIKTAHSYARHHDSH